MVGKSAGRKAGSPYLDGQFLIAMPGMEDERFARSVVYLCAHSEEGAMGIAVNRIAPQITFEQLLRQLEIIGDGPELRLPSPVRAMAVHNGGPVETGRGFVLHSSDYFVESSTLPIDDNISLTATLDILRAIAGGSGPRHAMLALGYAGWAPGQLESEIKANGWLHCGAEPGIIFETEVDRIYGRALASMGVDPVMLSSTTGHA